MPARKKSGFTLIELLVVIAIIAILAAILFPVFARAREAARKSNCASNMKECAIALQVYWTDYDATLPSSINATSTGSTFEAFAGHLGAIPIPTGWTGNDSLAKTWAQMLYPHMKSKDIMFCPSDGSPHYGTNDQNPLNTPRVSYFWKYAIDAAWNGTDMPNNDQCRKEGDFGYNSDQIVLYERQGFHTGEGNLKNDVKINAVYLDTHVRNVSIANAVAAGTDGKATPGSQAGEPYYFNFDQTQEKLAGTNPPTAPQKWVDPRVYSDMLP